MKFLRHSRLYTEENRKCSFCGEQFEINESGIDQHFLKLENERLPNTSPESIDVLVEPILEKPKYFCGYGCILGWIEQC